MFDQTAVMLLYIISAVMRPQIQQLSKGTGRAGDGRSTAVDQRRDARLLNNPRIVDVSIGIRFSRTPRNVPRRRPAGRSFLAGDRCSTGHPPADRLRSHTRSPVMRPSGTGSFLGLRHCVKSFSPAMSYNERDETVSY